MRCGYYRPSARVMGVQWPWSKTSRVPAVEQRLRAHQKGMTSLSRRSCISAYREPGDDRQKAQSLNPGPGKKGRLQFLAVLQKGSTLYSS